jgi:2-methylcitrate dehydratase PrpD
LAARYPDTGVIDMASVVLRLRDSRQFEVERDAARGSNGRPVSNAEIEHKFRTMTQSSIPSDQATAIIDTVRRLPDLTSIRELTDLLAPWPAAGPTEE